MDWYLLVLRRYADFDGRSRRKEYWMFALFNILVCIVLGFVGCLGFAASKGLGVVLFIPAGIYILAMIVPSIAVGVRRFHDTGKSGWLLLLLIVLGIIPFLGFIASLVQIIFLCTDSAPGTNQYGPNPKLFGEYAAVIPANASFNSAGVGVPPAPYSAVQNFGFCKNCGTKLVEGSAFCSVCGTRL